MKISLETYHFAGWQKSSARTDRAECHDYWYGQEGAIAVPCGLKIQRNPSLGSGRTAVRPDGNIKGEEGIRPRFFRMRII